MSKERFNPYDEVEARIAMVSDLRRLKDEGQNVDSILGTVEQGLFEAVDERLDKEIAQKRAETQKRQ